MFPVRTCNDIFEFFMIFDVVGLRSFMQTQQINKVYKGLESIATISDAFFVAMIPIRPLEIVRVGWLALKRAAKASSGVLNFARY